MRLQTGSKIGVISPSWGGPYLFPAIYKKGIQNVEQYFGLEVVELPTARMEPARLFENPRQRAEDINKAFADPGIDGIICTIGGEDSVRILPYLDIGLIRQNPKFLMGYSDVSSVLSWLSLNGIQGLHGPALMAGLAQLESFHESYREYLRRILFEDTAHMTVSPFSWYSEGYPDWAVPDSAGSILPPRPNPDGWKQLQGKTTMTGIAFGGCFEVLEMIKGTRFWPPESFWQDKIVFLETSEEKPDPGYIRRWLRNYGAQGVFGRCNGLVVGRGRGYSAEEKNAIDTIVTEVVGGEFGETNLPVISNFDIGHTDPQIVLPVGKRIEIDTVTQELTYLESVL